MKRRKLLKPLRAQGCELLREGANHSVWWNPKLRRTSTIPRHTEIFDLLSRKVCKDLGIPTP